MPAMKVLACTGGIGSGKTFVCKIFERLGVPVYYTDDAAKSMYSRPDVREKVKKAFVSSVMLFYLFSGTIPYRAPARVANV